MKELARSCSTDEKMADVPLNFRKLIYDDNDDNYTAFSMPGLLLCSISSSISSLSGLLLVADRRQGTLCRATVAGLSFNNVVLGHIVVQGILTIAQLVIWNIVLCLLFPIPLNSQVWLYVLICLLTGISASALGIFLGIIVNTEAENLSICAFLSFMLLLYSGIFWPAEAMNQFWQTVGTVFPTYLPTQSLRSVIVRGVGIVHSFVWPGILVSVFWTVGLVVFSVLIYRGKL